MLWRREESIEIKEELIYASKVSFLLRCSGSPFVTLGTFDQVLLKRTWNVSALAFVVPDNVFYASMHVLLVSAFPPSFFDS